MANTTFYVLLKIQPLQRANKIQFIITNSKSNKLHSMVNLANFYLSTNRQLKFSINNTSATPKAGMKFSI